MARRFVDQGNEPGGAADLADAERIIKVRGGEAFLTTRQVAAVLGKAVATVRDWRTRGIGPRYIRGGAVHYRWRDIQEWIDGKTVGTSDQPVAAGGGA